MNNANQISKAKRLSEEEVHAAADELKNAGIKPSSIEVYKHLGRGSLTTITNFLKTWHQEKSVIPLPALISLPDTLSKAAEQLIIKLWAESQALAEQGMNGRRDVLRQAEALANEKVAEAKAFSEEQSKKIEALEAKIEKLKDDHMHFLNEEKHLQAEINKAKSGETIYQTRLIECEKQLMKAEEKIAQLEKLKEKADKLEGEFVAWKSIKPENKPKDKKTSSAEHKD